MEYYNFSSQRYFDIVKREIVHPIFKVALLDYNENVIQEITRDISSNNNGSIDINYQQGVRRSCSITFIDPYGEYIPDVNKGVFWLNQKFKLYVGLEDLDTGDKYWFSQGVFYVNDPIINRTEKIVTINGVDKFGFFGSELNYNQLEGTYLIPEGTRVFDAIINILLLDRGNGQVIDPIAPILDVTYKNNVLPYDINKSPGSYLGDILIEIANVLGANIYYNTDGQLVLSSGTLDMSYSNKSPVYEFIDVLPEYGDSSLRYDYVNAINSITVVGSNINGAVYQYTAENRNTMSPLRIDLIGKKTGAIVETSNAGSLNDVMAYAKFLLNYKSIVQMAVDFSSSFLPHLKEDEVIEITDRYYKYEKERFIIQSIKIPLNPLDKMTISASNITSLPYYEL
mgnify:FL=1